VDGHEERVSQVEGKRGWRRYPLYAYSFLPKVGTLVGEKIPSPHKSWDSSRDTSEPHPPHHLTSVVMFQSILAIAILVLTFSLSSLVKGEEVGYEKLLDWDIKYMSVDADATARGKVSLSYHISANRMFKVGVYERDCLVPVTGAPISTSQTVNVTPEHNGLDITLDLNESIASRNVWESNTLQFCVKVRLLSVVGESIIDGEEEVIKEE
jgi:hypothetical protein